MTDKAYASQVYCQPSLLPAKLIASQIHASKFHNGQSLSTLESVPLSTLESVPLKVS
jgi:hypothetical protein